MSRIGAGPNRTFIVPGSKFQVPSSEYQRLSTWNLELPQGRTWAGPRCPFTLRTEGVGRSGRGSEGVPLFLPGFVVRRATVRHSQQEFLDNGPWHPMIQTVWFV